MKSKESCVAGVERMNRKHLDVNSERQREANPKGPFKMLLGF